MDLSGHFIIQLIIAHLFHSKCSISDTVWDKWLLLVHVTHLIVLLLVVLKFFKFILLHRTFYLESTAGLQFRVFYWPSWPMNLFTFRLLTPPGTPLFPSHEAAPKRSPVSQTGSPKTRHNSLKSRVSHWNMTLLGLYKNTYCGEYFSATHIIHKPAIMVDIKWYDLAESVHHVIISYTTL